MEPLNPISDGRLHPSAQAVILESNQVRLDFLDKPLWISYPAAESILQRLDRILKRPRNGRPEGLSIIGDPNNGKSHLLEYFQRKHPPEIAEQTGTLRLSVVCIQAPVGARHRDLYSSLCKALHIPDLPRGTLSRAKSRVIEALCDAGVKILVIDELHHLIAGGEMQKRIIIDDLKSISNELKIALVGAGTTRALQAVKLDDQYLSRMPPVLLPPWELGTTFLGLLAILETRLPLREPSGLVRQNMAEMIYAHSKRTIGATVSLVLEASRLALQEGHEKLDEDLIRRTGSGNLPWLKV
jgi:hypothetical protein